MDIQISIHNKTINLSNQNISNSTEIFTLLKSLPDISTIEELNLSFNQITKLSNDLSYFHCLKHLNIESNLLEDMTQTAISLKSLPKLESLKITLSKNEEYSLLFGFLPNLKFINNLQKKEIKESKEEKQSQSKGVVIDLNEADISETPLSLEHQRYNQIFTKINEKIKLQGREAVNVFFTDYQKITDEGNETIENVKGGLRMSHLSALLSVKYRTLTYFIEKLLDLNEKKDKDLTILLKEVMMCVGEVNSTSNDMISKLIPKIEEQQVVMNRRIEEAKMGNNTSAEYEKLLSKYNALKFEMETYKDENYYMKSKYEGMEKENQVLIDKVIKLTKDLANNQVTSSNIVSLGSPDKFKAYYNMTKIVSPKKNIKVLTKKNMHDLIESIYDSKLAYDKKCIDVRMPRETMEEHMYTFLNQKFGLKNLIIEWATSIVNGIKMYSSEDSDICLFGKILRNEIEEDYRFIFKKLKNSISDLLVVSINI